MVDIRDSKSYLVKIFLKAQLFILDGFECFSIDKMLYRKQHDGE